MKIKDLNLRTEVLESLVKMPLIKGYISEIKLEELKLLIYKKHYVDVVDKITNLLEIGDIKIE